MVLLGDGAVGKTCLIRKFVYDIFDDKYIVTLGAKATKKVMSVTPTGSGDQMELKLLIYDILGQKHHVELTEMYYRGSEGALLVCDLTRKTTLESLASWVESLKRVVGEVPLVVLGNKSDLKERAQFGVAELKAVADSYGAPFMLTSAKTGENVEEGFAALGLRIADRFMGKQKG